MSENRGFPCGIRFLNFQNYLTSKPSFFLTLRTSQTLEKLALIQGYLYIREDFSGGRFTATKNLSIDKFSQNGGEKPVHQDLEGDNGLSFARRVSSKFGDVVRGIGTTMVGITMLSGGTALAQSNPAQTVQPVAAITNVSTTVPDVPMSDRMEIPDEEAQYVAARGSKLGILVLAYGNNKWMIDELKHAVFDGHQKGHAVKGIALGSSSAPDGFDVYVNGHRIAESRDVENTDVRGGAIYAIGYGQKLLETKFATKITEQANLDY